MIELSRLPKLSTYASSNMRMNARCNYEEMAEKPPDPKATERFKRPAYQLERCDVAEYLAKKHDVKGEMRSGQENS